MFPLIKDCKLCILITLSNISIVQDPKVKSTATETRTEADTLGLPQRSLLIFCQ